MSINKVVYGANTLIDLTADTVTSTTMTKGTTAHDKSGAGIVGGLKRAYTFVQTDGNYSVFCLPMAGGSVADNAWTVGDIGASVSNSILTIGG